MAPQPGDRGRNQMENLLSPDETRLLTQVWADQTPTRGPALDLTLPHLTAPPRASSAEEVAAALGRLLQWPQWVRLYPKPSLAVVALSRLLRSQGRPGGVLWVAPGTGAPLDPPRGEPGLALLRADWSPAPEAMLAAQEMLGERGLHLVVDESATGLRLAPGGAIQACGLTPQAALYGPALAGGRDFAALAGVGPAPEPGPPPAPEALAAAQGALDWAGREDLSARCRAWGRSFTLGLQWFAQKAQLAGEVAWDGPLALPRLKGRRLWAFTELCKEEGLTLGPLLFFDPGQDPALCAELAWPRLCRALMRLKVLPQGEKAPHGWSEAQETGFAATAHAPKGFEE